jgi:hypothetical protein
MFSIKELTQKFNALDADSQSKIFEQLTKNPQFYNQLMPNLPLIKYILEGEAAVPVSQHGPIITAYKEWLTKPKNRARLRN